MKILLLGGSGAMGIHLTKLLSDDGYEVFITSRSPRESIGNKHYLLGNAQELIFLQSILQKKWDVIIDFMIYTTISFEERVNLLLNSTLHYVFLSSSRVYSGVNHLITEKTPLLKATPEGLCIHELADIIQNADRVTPISANSVAR